MFYDEWDELELGTRRLGRERDAKNELWMLRTGGEETHPKLGNRVNLILRLLLFMMLLLSVCLEF